MYFLIHCSEDGDISVKQYSKDELLRLLKDEDYGFIEFFDKMPKDSPVYWEKVLIIKGEIMCPKPIEVVKQYEI